MIAVGEAGVDGKNPEADGRDIVDDGKDPGVGYGTEVQDAGLLDNMMEWGCNCGVHNWSSCDLQKQTDRNQAKYIKLLKNYITKTSISICVTIMTRYCYCNLLWKLSKASILYSQKHIPPG